MTFSVAFLMDPIEKLNLKTDSTLRLAWEAARRNYNIFIFEPKDLIYSNNKICGNLAPFFVMPDDYKKTSRGESLFRDLSEMDIIFIRQDPPFDMRYLTTTYLLEMLPKKVLILNNPLETRSCPEKIFLNNFSSLTPPTLITRDKKQIDIFLEKYEEIILKPIYAHGGKDVFYINKHDVNYNAIYENLTEKYNDSIIAQKYLKEVKEGDKRIILLNGKPIAALLRVPNEGQVRSNMAVGGKAVKVDLSKRDHEICDIIGPSLKQKGLLLAGIDVIGGYLTEINITSPTTIAVINELYDTCLEKTIWDEILKTRLL